MLAYYIIYGMIPSTFFPLSLLSVCFFNIWDRRLLTKSEGKKEEN